MISNPFFLISILISALLAFATTAAIVESAIVLIRIQPGRLRSCLRCLPFLSLLLDVLFDSLSIGYWLNPFNCSSCIQKMMLSLFLPDLKDYLHTHELSLLNYLGSGISHEIFSIAFVTFFLFVLYFFVQRLIGCWSASGQLFALMQKENICRRPLENRALAAAIENSRVRVYVCNGFTTPMATSFRAIFLPREVAEQFSQSEFEAVLAHELEHILWRDPHIRLLAQLIGALFWWVPVASWEKKLEFDQEVACDGSISKYGLQKEFLASALIKVAAAEKRVAHEAFCYLKSSQHPALMRLEMMLGAFRKPSKPVELLSVIFIAIEIIIGSVCAISS